MIAETLAGIALVKSAVDGIKSTINTANDIGDIAKYVDNLLEGEKQVQQQRAKKSGASIGDQFGIESVAQEVIDARIAQEKIQEMSGKETKRKETRRWSEEKLQLARSSQYYHVERRVGPGTQIA